MENTMSSDERAAFEQSLETDSAARAKFDLQKQIDGSLVAMYGNHHAPQGVMKNVCAAAEQRATSPRQPYSIFMHRRWAAAAILFISACITWEIHLLQDVSLPIRLTAIRQPTMMEAYQRTTGLESRYFWANTDGQDLAETLRWNQGEVLRLKGMPETTKLIGKARLNGVSVLTTAALFEVEGQDVITFIDRAENDDARFMTEQQPGLNIFRRYLGEDFILFEISPYDMPKVVDKFYEAGI
jgi:hypothetical protein